MITIHGYEVSQHTMETYLRACRYNQATATRESDLSQRKSHDDVMEELGVTVGDADYNKVSAVVDAFVSDLIYRGY